jgi:hypothetical protein
VWDSGAIHEGIVDGDDEDLASVLDLGVLDVAGDVGVGAGWTWIGSAQIRLSIRAYVHLQEVIAPRRDALGIWGGGEAERDLLKAAGTPMIRPFPSPNSVARLTLFPGPPSSSSTVGMESPGLTIVAVLCVYVYVVGVWLRVQKGATK